ncbi:MAG TPA: NADPH-dependent F420 reductase [Dehalococcoidia bacterium]|nr:NADPH-dependent F420 reductase [Dehalococcoidia bacterium]
MADVGFIGGTGPEGKGLAVRFAHAGLSVIIGSRSAERGAEAAAEVTAIGGGNVTGGTNLNAAAADVIVVTVPYAGLADTLADLEEAIGDKTVVSAVVPLKFGGGRVTMLDVPDGSAAEETQRLLPRARVVGAFQNLAAGHLLDMAHPVDGDVIVCSDDKEALASVIELAQRIEGIRGVNGGPLSVSRFVEGVTALLVNINRANKVEAAIKVVGL